MHYDVEFYSGDTEYDYEIDAYTCEVLSHSKETENVTPSAGQDKSYIGDTAAEDKALAHAGVKRADAQGLRTKLDVDGRSAHYDIEFYSGNTEYDYEIDAYTCEVLSHSKETENVTPSAGQNQTYSGDTAAEDKALSHAGVKRADAQGLHIKLDTEGRSAHYDIEFYSGDTEYDYEIDAYTGEVISHSKETENVTTSAGQDKHYDIEFYSGNTEYDYEIDAYSGNIIDFDKDIDD